MKLIKIIAVSAALVLGSGCSTFSKQDEPDSTFNQSNVVSANGDIRTEFTPVALSTEAAIAHFDAQFRTECTSTVTNLIQSQQQVEAITSNDKLDDSAQAVREVFLGMAAIKWAETQAAIAQFKLQAVGICNQNSNVYASRAAIAQSEAERDVARSESRSKAWSSIAKSAMGLGLGAMAFGAVTVAGGGEISF